MSSLSDLTLRQFLTKDLFPLRVLVKDLALNYGNIVSRNCLIQGKRWMNIIFKRDFCYLFSAEKESRDFSKENYRKIKEIQRANKEKQIESARQTPVKAVYKLNKYDHIQSKVSQRIQVRKIFCSTFEQPLKILFLTHFFPTLLFYTPWKHRKTLTVFKSFQEV